MSGNEIDEDILVGISYIPLMIIIVGVIGNTFAFLVFCSSSKMRRMSSMLYLSFIAITDTLSLFTWNLNHFLQPNHLPMVESISLASCRFFNFLQYTSLQSSGLLYSMLSIDRYFTIVAMPGSFLKKAFGTRNSAVIWSTSIVTSVIILNSHLLFNIGYYKTVISSSNTTNETTTVILVCNEASNRAYTFNPTWDYVNIAFYNFIPFVLMAIFNTLLIVKTFKKRTNSNVPIVSPTILEKEKKDSHRKRRLTRSLFIITIGFLVMTLPGNIVYGFFFNELRPTYIGHSVLIACDCFLFTQHAIVFFMCLATNTLFRQAVCDTLKKCSRTAGSKTLVDTKTELSSIK